MPHELALGLNLHAMGKLVFTDGCVEYDAIITATQIELLTSVEDEHQPNF